MKNRIAARFLEVRDSCRGMSGVVWLDSVLGAVEVLAGRDALSWSSEEISEAYQILSHPAFGGRE